MALTSSENAELFDSTATTEALDPILIPYLTARTEGEAASRLEDIFSRSVRPAVLEMRQSKFPRSESGQSNQETEDAEDFVAGTLGRVSFALAKRRDNPADKPIDNLRAYAKRVAESVFADYMRSRYPNRTRLQNQVRYELDHHTPLARWLIRVREAHVAHGGLRAWKVEGRTVTRTQRLLEFLARPRHWAAAKLPLADAASMRLAKLLTAIFQDVQTPVEVERLIDPLCDLRNVVDEPSHSSSPAETQGESNRDPVQKAQDRQAVERFDREARDAEADEERKRLLADAWREIVQLKPMARAALLLQCSFKNEDRYESAVSLLTESGTASLRDIAAALEMPLETLAGLSSSLPLKDKQVAELLGSESTKVSSQREIALRRLKRRLKMP